MTPLTDNEREVLILIAESNEDHASRPEQFVETSRELERQGLVLWANDETIGRLTDRGRDRLLADMARIMADQARRIESLEETAVRVYR